MQSRHTRRAHISGPLLQRLRSNAWWPGVASSLSHPSNHQLPPELTGTNQPPRNPSHESEGGLEDITPDRVIINDGTIDQLKEKIYG